MSQQQKVTDVPEVESPAVELLRGGAALAKAENDTLAQVAVTRPRNPARSLERAMRELDVVPEFAERQWYSIPYKDRKAGVTRNVEGLSIKAAMALARCWGNCTASARVIEETADGFMVEGVFIDFETMFRVSKPVLVSRFYKDSKTGRMVKLSDDRLPQVVGSAGSKAVRNAILNGIPESVQQAYWKHARDLSASQERKRSGGKASTTRLAVKSQNEALQKFAVLGVDRSMLETHLGHPLSETTVEEGVQLKGVLNALESGEAKVSDVFDIEVAEETDGAVTESGGGDQSPLFDRSGRKS